jgi:hypothetical protein
MDYVKKIMIILGFLYGVVERIGPHYNFACPMEQVLDFVIKRLSTERDFIKSCAQDLIKGSNLIHWNPRLSWQQWLNLLILYAVYARM